MEHLQNSSGSGEYPPQNVWWLYAQICRARSDEPKAQRALREAYNLIKAKANLIHNPDPRRSYLENVRVNAAVTTEIVNCE